MRTTAMRRPQTRTPRHEPLRRTARSPRLRARPQQQATAVDLLFSRGRRSRSRLRAGGVDGRIVVQARKTRADPRPDRIAHRSGADFGHISATVSERSLSYDYVGDLSETVALMWPKSSPSPACGGGP